MLNDKTLRATNFACVHAGPKEGWKSSAWSRPMSRCQPGASCSCGTPGVGGPGDVAQRRTAR